MRQITLATVGVIGVGLAATAAIALDEKPGRYTMTPADNGAMLKLDTATGATSMCTKSGAEWSCQPMRDGEQVLRREIDGLKGEVQVLREQLTKTEELAGIGDPNKKDGSRPGAGVDGPRPGSDVDGPRPGTDGSRPQAKTQLPSEKDVDQAFDYFEGMVKKLRERFKRLENEGKSTPL